MPIIDTQDAQELHGHLQRFFDANPAERAHRLRQLFTEKFDFHPATGKVSLAKAPRNVTLPPDADRIASVEGINVVYMPLRIPGTTRVRKAEAVEAARVIARELGDDMLLLMTNEQPAGGATQLHVILPTFLGSTPALRRMVIERDLPRRTALQQLSNIYHQWQQKGDLRLALEEAFNVEAVTSAFFHQYREVFGRVQELVKTFPGTDDGREAKKLFVQTLFNRLMFIYFLSRKGWLKFKGDRDYLNALWVDYQQARRDPERSEQKNFYEHRLKPLFFAGLNNERSADLMRNNPAMYALIGDVQFLNGGLFDQLGDDKRSDIEVPDAAIDLVLRNRPSDYGLLNRFNFTVMESTPLDQEVAVDPEMLGKVFEELVTGRHETGSYYTPRLVVSFMCREALKGYLQGAVPSLPAQAIHRFVDQRDVSGFNLTNAEVLRQALAGIKVVDPACGSGAYLLGMMHELVDLETALYSERLVTDPKSLYDLKLRIIEENVYGADIDQFAVNIAMLRLWLSLAIDYESFPPPPLPNLDFKIVCGDSLIAPDPNPSVHGAQYQMFRQQVHAASGRLAKLKHQHMNAVDPEKRMRAEEIQKELANLRAALAFAPAPKDAVDWRVTFAEVFDQKGGFHIAIANPPYRRQEGLSTKKEDLKQLYPSVYASTADYHVYFYNRSVQLLRDGGVLSFITSNKYMRAGYGEKIRGFLPSTLTLSQAIDFGDLPVFTAAAYPAIVVGQKQQPLEGHVLRVADLAAPIRRYLTAQGKPVNRETVTAVMERLPTFLAESAVPAYPQVLLRKSGWILEDPALVRLFDRLMSQGTPLRKFVNGRMYAGIKTGLNDAFVIDEAKRQELIKADPTSATLIKPWLRGRDIKRWRAERSGYYLIAIQNSDDRDAHNPWEKTSSEAEARRIFRQMYPAIHDHLSSFEQYEVVDKQGRKKKVGLRLREDQGKWWWELRACRFYREFGKPKVVWPDITRIASFAWDTSGAHADMTLFFTTGLQRGYLTLLNSIVAQLLLTFLTYSIRGGYLRLKLQWLGLFPIPALEQSAIKSLQHNGDNTEEVATEMACAAYNLRPDEVILLQAWYESAVLPTLEADLDSTTDTQDDE